MCDKLYDVGQDGFLDLAELKIMMEKLGAPQTHLSLKAMISEVDEDKDGKISFREFLLIYRKAKAGELTSESGLEQLARLTEISVEEVGVNGAKNFFEAKIEEQLKTNKFHDEIRQEQEERKRAEQEKIVRRAQFQQKAAIFNN
ncbi:EF-hand domain-containing protein D2 homolog [Sergentomyia squamirostris]